SVSRTFVCCVCTSLVSQMGCIVAANHTESLLFAKFGILSAGSSAEYFCREDSTRPHHFATGDNDDAYNLTPAFILETVAAAKGFLEGNGTKTVHNVMDKRRGLGPQISDFLAWPVMRIETALAQLHAIEEGKLSKQAVEELPTIHAATVLHRAVLRSPAKIMRMKP